VKCEIQLETKKEQTREIAAHSLTRALAILSLINSALIIGCEPS